VELVVAGVVVLRGLPAQDDPQAMKPLSEVGQRWGVCMTLMKKRQRQCRWMRRLNGVAVIFNLSLALNSVLGQHHWGAILQVLLAWLMYRLYRNTRKREQLWRECFHHAQRMWVETAEHALWHSQRMDEVLEELKKT